MVSRLFSSGWIALTICLCAPAYGRGESAGVAWRSNLDAAKVEAAQSGRLLLLHFYTQTCAPCKALDATVLSQPQVAAAVEQNYVPVKVDADAQRALAAMFRIEQVPTEVVLTPQGTVVAVLSVPGKPDEYIDQLQNLAVHFRQQQPRSGSAAPPATVNNAYASLPMSTPQAPAVAANRATTPAVAAQPQVNPYIAASSPTSPPAGAAAQGAAAWPSVNAAMTPAMPTNAMPQSYRNSYAADSSAAPSQGVPGQGAGGAAAANAVVDAAGAVHMAGPATPPQIRATQPALPANCPPVAFDGCCPVTLKMQNKWAPGSTQFGAVHRGRTYLFANDQLRQQFLADPDAYSPVFAGYDPVLLLDKQQSVQGTRRYGYRFGDAFYLFSTPETMARFKASPQTYAAGVRQAMARVDANAQGTILR